MLAPANRTEQTWWQQHVEPYRDRPGGVLRTEFLPGRIRFLAPGQGVIKPNERPPFGCCLLIWGDLHESPLDLILFPGTVNLPPSDRECFHG